MLFISQKKYDKLVAENSLLNKRNIEKNVTIEKLMNANTELNAIIQRKDQPRDTKGHLLTTKEVATPSQN